MIIIEHLKDMLKSGNRYIDVLEYYHVKNAESWRYGDRMELSQTIKEKLSHSVSENFDLIAELNQLGEAIPMARSLSADGFDVLGAIEVVLDNTDSLPVNSSINRLINQLQGGHEDYFSNNEMNQIASQNDRRKLDQSADQVRTQAKARRL